jgi:uncharacterized protein YjbI with pentapeptide repeats
MTLKKIAVLTALSVLVLLSAQRGSSAFDEDHMRRLTGTRECPGCDLTGADLSNRDLRGANLMNANLAGANLTRADLTNATLYFADFRGANITGAKFGGARLTNAVWPDGHLCAHKSIGACKEKE